MDVRITASGVSFKRHNYAQEGARKVLGWRMGEKLYQRFAERCRTLGVSVNLKAEQLVDLYVSGRLCMVNGQGQIVRLKSDGTLERFSSIDHPQEGQGG